VLRGAKRNLGWARRRKNVGGKKFRKTKKNVNERERAARLRKIVLYRVFVCCVYCIVCDGIHGT